MPDTRTAAEVIAGFASPAAVHAVHQARPRHLAEPPPAERFVPIYVPVEDARMVSELLSRESTVRSHRARLEGHPGVRRTLERQAGALLTIATQLYRAVPR